MAVRVDAAGQHEPVRGIDRATSLQGIRANYRDHAVAHANVDGSWAGWKDGRADRDREIVSHRFEPSMFGVNELVSGV